MTRTEHDQDGPVALMITGGAAKITVLASPDVARAYVESDDDVKVESRGENLKVKIPREGTGSTTVVQSRRGSITIIGDGDLVIGDSITIGRVGRSVNVFSSGGSVNQVNVGDGDQEVVVHVRSGSSLDVDVRGGDIVTDGVLTSVNAVTGSGEVQLDQVSGRATIRTGSGDVTIAGVNIAEVRTGSGDITIDEVARKATLRTGSGDIVTRSTAQLCQVFATTGSGNVTSHGRGIELDASTGSGRVRQRS